LIADFTKNWTRPDNIFGTEHITDALIECTMNPSQRGPCTDHLPIITIIELKTPKMDKTPQCNWRNVDWTDFNDKLKTLLSPYSAIPLASNDKFQIAAKRMTKAITDTIDQCIPHSRPSPHSKRWWTKDLSNFCRHVNHLSCQAYQMRAILNHPCHDELKRTRHQY
ncbi:hypothetical protein BDR03DRAFT_821072, partial [Suillus americanus]